MNLIAANIPNKPKKVTNGPKMMHDFIIAGIEVMPIPTKNMFSLFMRYSL